MNETSKKVFATQMASVRTLARLMLIHSEVTPVRAIELADEFQTEFTVFKAKRENLLNSPPDEAEQDRIVEEHIKPFAEGCAKVLDDQATLLEPAGPGHPKGAVKVPNNDLASFTPLDELAKGCANVLNQQERIVANESVLEDLKDLICRGQVTFVHSNLSTDKGMEMKWNNIRMRIGV